MSYLASVITAGISRYALFEAASSLPYPSTRYFREVHRLVKGLKYDYAEAFRIVGERAHDDNVRFMFLRLSSALASGEPMETFFWREAQIQGEAYGEEYERQIESLRKWTDAYSALLVSASLVVIIAFLTLMVYHLHEAILLPLMVLGPLAAFAGAWIIARVAPQEPITHHMGPGSPEQRLNALLARVLLPAAVVLAALLFLLRADVGWILLTTAACLIPMGAVQMWDERKIYLRDMDIGTFVRALGGMSRAMGTTLTEALNYLDNRSTGALAAEVRRLRAWLRSKLLPENCWHHFVQGSGSALVERTVRAFWDGISRGGDPAEVGVRSSAYALKVALLRAKRRTVADTFSWLSFPLHLVIVGLLLFSLELVGSFSRAVSAMDLPEISQDQLSQLPAMPLPGVLGVQGGLDMGFLAGFMKLVTIALTIANAYAVYSAYGGHPFKLFYHGGIMLAMTGMAFLIVPRLMDMLFTTIMS